MRLLAATVSRYMLVWLQPELSQDWWFVLTFILLTVLCMAIDIIQVRGMMK